MIAILVDVIAPSLPYPYISIPICILIVLNLCMHYFYAITTTSGIHDDPPRESRDIFLWSQKPNLEKENKATVRGASWSEKGVKITPAHATECQKCKTLRPEVKLKTFF